MTPGLSLWAGGTHSDVEPWSGGIHLIQDLWTRWSRANITQVGSLIAIAGTLPALGRFLRRTWREVHGWVSFLLLSSVTIPGGDPINRSVVTWMMNQKPRSYRAFTGHTEMARGAGAAGDSRAAALKKTQHAVTYFPHWRTRWFWHDGAVFLVTRVSDIPSVSASDPGFDSVGAEDLTISCLGWAVDPVKKLIESCRELTERQTQFFVIIYTRDRYGMGWKPKARAPLRRLDTVHFDKAAKGRLLRDMRNFLSPETQARYQSRSMPYRRGYLFHGPPGTGKSSLSVAVAGEFGLDLYEVKVPSVATDADLEQMFLEIPPRCVVLLEDIDAVWTDRSGLYEREAGSHKHKTRQQQQQQQQPPSNQPQCTLSGLLNVLDGVGSQEGRIVIMTTNYPEMLDEALTRPGRVDMKVFLGNISKSCAKDMFLRMFSPDLGCASSVMTPEELGQLAAEFASHIPDDAFTPSSLQGFFQLHLQSPVQALSEIGDWVTTHGKG